MSPRVLKRGTCRALMCNDLLSNPYLQVLGVISVPPAASFTNALEFQLKISDGFEAIYAMLNPSLNYLVVAGRIKVHTILAVRTFFAVEFCTLRIVRLEDVAVAGAATRLYGQPTSLDISLDPANAAGQVMKFLLEDVCRNGFTTQLPLKGCSDREDEDFFDTRNGKREGGKDRQIGGARLMSSAADTF
ncbi:hypothetical protein CALCODRAFT_482519 [Calocera cornea HHB12733]|uniref:Replication factor-A protein 1 N-terminal domain-containing protein n=1 Tax=Calocera cornea HHB12733 TaxID=1353952 RepID=A0A165GMU8_9BASI|nr:hypothetical protein CALCODRAFT_482519 [Calocera cornea HHB12733]